MLPFEPESEFLLKQRYKDAVEPVYSLDEMEGPNRPSLRRQHVFDFQDGLRLIITRERYPEGQVVLHWSASIDKDIFIKDKFPSVHEFIMFIMEHMHELWDSEEKHGSVIIKNTGSDVFHFFLEEEGGKIARGPDGLRVEFPGGNPRMN
jgi:hypothetical protein